MSERAGKLSVFGWWGDIDQPVVVVGETPKKWRIRPAGDSTVRLGGRGRTLEPGQTTLVPKYAIEFDDVAEPAQAGSGE